MIDFGISRAAEVVSVAGVGQVVGSPGFMSPEQAMGAEIGPPSDIFSLGAVLTFAATGGGPFGEGSSPELAYRLVYGPPSLGQLPPQLRPLVERCLAKDPRERPTADEVLAEAGAVQPATGWPLGALAQHIPPNPVAATSAPRQAPPAGRRRRDPAASLVAAAGRGCDGGRARSVGRGQLRPERYAQALIRRAVAGAGGHLDAAPGPADVDLPPTSRRTLLSRPGTKTGHHPRGGHGHAARYARHVRRPQRPAVLLTLRDEVPVGVCLTFPVPDGVTVPDAEPVPVHLVVPAGTADYERGDIQPGHMGLF